MSSIQADGVCDSSVMADVPYLFRFVSILAGLVSKGVCYEKYVENASQRTIVYKARCSLKMLQVMIHVHPPARRP